MELNEGLSHVVYLSLPSLPHPEILFGGDGAELTHHILVPSNARPILMGNLLKYLTFAGVGKLAISS